MQVLKSSNADIKLWTDGVPVESQAVSQLMQVAALPFIFKHLAVMPDVHFGNGATVGSVIASKSAIVPAAVGVDIGCGMNAVRLSLKASDLPDNLKSLRTDIEIMVPVGKHSHELHSVPHKFHTNTKKLLNGQMRQVQSGFDYLVEKHPDLVKMSKNINRTVHSQIGSLGGGNHFIELCIDENEDVWVMLHSGSRGIGNIIGRYFIQRAKKRMDDLGVSLPNKDLAYLEKGTDDYTDYVIAVEWAQDYAFRNRQTMMKLVLESLERKLPAFTVTKEAINCHHNYISNEVHFGEEVHVTRKGAVSAQLGQLGIIPGSMGAKSFIVRGLGNAESFCSCSHGAGRVMSRGEAKRTITLDEHLDSTNGVECRKDEGVLDESPAAYKDIDAVMAAQEDLVEIMHTLKQVLCVKG